MTTKGCAYVGGEYVAPADARISIFDWGFLRSDATYDVAHVWRGRFFRLDDHLERFIRNMERLRLDCGKSRDEIRRVMHGCVRRSGLREAYVEVICTRGVPLAGSRDPRSAKNQFMAFAIPFVWIADPDKQQNGIDLVVSPRQRIPPDSVDPTIKNYHWLDLTQALFDAYDRDGETVVLGDGAGNVTEGPGFNVFAVHDNGGRKTLTTPDRGVLEGITRKTMIELGLAHGHEVVVGTLPVERLRTADEIFLSSTGGGAIAVSHLDGVAIGGREPGVYGPVTRQLQQAYWQLHEDPAYTEAVDYDAG
jgi:branched-chain amino acid aminotransferase